MLSMFYLNILVILFNTTNLRIKFQINKLFTDFILIYKRKIVNEN